MNIERTQPALVLAVLRLSMALSVAPAQAISAITFTSGIASGDVTPFSATVWTRANRQAMLIVETATSATFRSRTLQRSATALAASAFAVSGFVAPLAPDTRCNSRFAGGASQS